MKKVFLLLTTFTLICVALKAQTEPDWTRVLQASTHNYPAGKVVAADGDNIYMAGTFGGPVTFENTLYTSVGFSDMIVFKFTDIGDVTWVKQFNAQATGSIIPSAMQVDANQCLYVVGAFSGSATFGSNTIVSDVSNNSFIAKLDPGGNVKWAKAFFSAGTGSSKMVFDADSNVYLLNKTAALLKFDIAGNKIWEQNFPNRTVQAIAVSGTNLYLGGALQSGTTTFGTLNLTKTGTAYNKGFIVKADLDGVYSDSLVVSGSPVNDGSSVNDIIVDLSGNLVITGAYSNNLGLRNTTFFNNSTTRYYTFLAKCDRDFNFLWVKSSNAILIARDNYNIRLFQDYSNNIYQYGLSTLGNTTFTYGSVSVAQQSQYLFKFDVNGLILNGYGLQNSAADRIAVMPTGKIAVTGNVFNNGNTQFGNFFIAQYHNNVIPNWQKYSSNHQAGTININYVKHDTIGNTYAQARIQGYCNFFGTIINNDNGTTINAKFDKSGNVLWVNKIDDLSLFVMGPKFTVDKDNNLLTIGSFSTSLSIGSLNLYNSNSFNDGYVVKYSQGGQVLWATQLATEGSHEIMGITSDKAGNVIISGEFKNQLTVGGKILDASTVDGVFIIKLDSNGNCLWAKGFPIGDIVYVVMPSTDDNNNIYMAGEMYNFTTNQLVFGTVVASQTTDDGGTVLLKLNPDGVPQWAYTYGGVTGRGYSDGWPVDIRTDAAGNSYLLGYGSNNAKFGSSTLTNPLGTSYSYYLTKINTNGIVDWADAVYFKSPVFRYGDLLDLDENGNLYVGGHFKDATIIQGTTYNPVGTNDFFAAKYNNNGVFKWIKTMPANTSGISALSIYTEDILSICGTAGKDPTLGNFNIDRLGASTCIIATLGLLEPLPNTLFVDFAQGSETIFSFTSNTDWTVTSDQEWLTVSSNSGTGNGTLIFTASANTTGEARTATVTITFLNSKAPSITLTIIQEAEATGIADLLKKETLVYPNPANNYLYLNSDAPDALISIYDSKGKLILSKQVNAGEINISNLRNGIYTIKMSSKTGIKTQKFVKQ